MKKIAHIKDIAQQIGACDKITGVTGYESLVQLFFTPQGREFCRSHNYPTIVLFESISDDVRPYNVFVNRGDIEVYNVHNIALIGNTHAKIKMRGVDDIYRVLLMHGATAEIEASHYAVGIVDNISGGDVAIHNDKTTKVRYEHQSHGSH